jgi:hypothetical protein
MGLNFKDSEEEWRVIPSFPDYEASSKGRIRRKTKPSGRAGGTSLPGRVLKSVPARGWKLVNLGGVCTKKVSILVAETFLGKRKKDHDVHHIDRNKTNDSASNLVYLQHADHSKLHAEARLKKPTVCLAMGDGKLFKENKND